LGNRPACWDNCMKAASISAAAPRKRVGYTTQNPAVQRRGVDWREEIGGSSQGPAARSEDGKSVAGRCAGKGPGVVRP